MGVYAQTNITIECKDAKTAKKLEQFLQTLKQDENSNEFMQDIERDKNYITGFNSSGRIQNLEWQCEQLWEKIKAMDGVIKLDCPFMSEADGCYFEK